MRHEVVDAGAVQRRDHEGRARRRLVVACRWPASSSVSRLTRSILLSTRIFGCVDVRRALRGCASASLVEAALARVDQQHDDVGIPGAAPGGVDHGAVEPAPRLEDAGRVDEDDLASSPAMAMPRTRQRVVCTLWVTIETLAPTSALTSVDLPALGAPMRATKPQRCLGARRRLRSGRSSLGRSRRLRAQQGGGGGLLGLALVGAFAARRAQALDAAPRR